MLRAFKKIGGAEKEVSDGSLRHDICATGVGHHERLLIDVGVTTVEYNQSESYFPSSREIKAATQLSKEKLAHPPQKKKRS